MTTAAASSEPSCSVRFAHDGELPAVRQFLAENFPADGHQNRPGWLDWQLADPTGVRLALAWMGDELAGLSIFQRVEFRLPDGGPADGAFATCTMVGERFRRHGIGSALHRLRTETYGYALSSGQSRANARVYGRLGFGEIAAYHEVLLQRSWPRFFARKRWLRHLFSWFLFHRPGRFPARSRFALVPNENFEIPEDWFAARTGEGRRFCRNGNPFLVWRFKRHPYLAYAASWVLQDGERIGVAIHREAGGGVARLVDAYWAPGCLDRVLVGFCRRTAARSVAGVVAGERLAAAFRQAGFHVFPHATYVLAGSNDPKLQPYLADGQWCFFAADSDKDR